MFEIGRHSLETKHGRFLLVGHLFGDNQQVVLTAACLEQDSRPWLLRVQFGCVNATAFSATDCDCGSQIDSALHDIQEYGKGLFIYFRDHEAFGLGLAEKIRIVAEEKRSGLDFHAVLRAEKSAAPRSDIMWVVPQVLVDLEISKSENFVLLSGSTEKRQALEQLGLRIERVLPI
jgi:GTP cyclohydrolase II